MRHRGDMQYLALYSTRGSSGSSSGKRRMELVLTLDVIESEFLDTDLLDEVRLALELNLPGALVRRVAVAPSWRP